MSEEIKQKGTRLKVWLTSDLHYSHPSILYFHPKRREAAGITLEELQADKNLAIEKHDEWLIKLWNDTVKREDFVYILGDFCLGNRERTEKILSKLHGRKYLIQGNHDKSLKGLENYFESYEGKYDIGVTGSLKELLDGELMRFKELVARITGCEAKNAIPFLNELLEKVLPLKPLHEYGFKESDIKDFAESVEINQQRLITNSYIPWSRELSERVYKECF